MEESQRLIQIIEKNAETEMHPFRSQTNEELDVSQQMTVNYHKCT